jgi:hypothetical protein
MVRTTYPKRQNATDRATGVRGESTAHTPPRLATARIGGETANTLASQ